MEQLNVAHQGDEDKTVLANQLVQRFNQLKESVQKKFDRAIVLCSKDPNVASCDHRLTNWNIKCK